MNVLLHVCCALCYAKALPGILPELQGGAFAAFWFNPNIHPLIEYRRRLKAVRVFSERLPHALHIDDEYGLAEFCRRTARTQERPGRCSVCYDWRLERTAQRARELGLEAFTTTLCTSPHQDHARIQASGERAAAAHGVRFLYRDWRECEADEALLRGIYRQQYCGCVFSEEERYRTTTLHLYHSDSESAK